MLTNNTIHYFQGNNLSFIDSIHFSLQKDQKAIQVFYIPSIGQSDLHQTEHQFDQIRGSLLTFTILLKFLN